MLVSQMQFQKRKSDLALFKDRAEALQKAVDILEEGIASSRAQVGYLKTVYTRQSYPMLRKTIC